MRDLYICETCDLISSRYKSDVFLYDKSYYDRYLKYKDDKIGKQLLKMRSALVYKYVTEGALLDYGCAVGDFHLSLNHGIKGQGYDINPNFGFTSIDNIDISIMTLWDVIEHMNDPVDLIKKANADYVFISTPSTDDYLNDDYGNWRHYRPHEHVHYFNEKSLTAFLKKLGYRILEVNYEESKIRESGGDKNILTVVGGLSGKH